MPFCLAYQSLFVSIAFLLLNEAVKLPAADEPKISIENGKCILQHGSKRLNVQTLHGLLLDKDGWLAKLIPSLAKKPIYLVETFGPKNSPNFNFKFTVLAAVVSPAAAQADKASDKKALIVKAATDCAKHATNKAHKPIVDHETPCKLIVSRPQTDKEEYLCKLPPKPAEVETAHHNGGKSNKKPSTATAASNIYFRIVKGKESLPGSQGVQECLIKEDKKQEGDDIKGALWQRMVYPAFVIPDVKNKLFLLIGEGIHRIALSGLKCQADHCLFTPLKCGFEILHKVKFITTTSTKHDDEKSEVHDAYQKSMKSVAGHKDAPPEQCRGKWQAPSFGIRGGDNFMASVFTTDNLR